MAPRVAEALSRDIPVIVGLNVRNAEAFHVFTGGEAIQPKPDAQSVIEWLQSTANLKSAPPTVGSLQTPA